MFSGGKKTHKTGLFFKPWLRSNSAINRICQSLDGLLWDMFGLCSTSIMENEDNTDKVEERSVFNMVQKNGV